GDGKGDYRNCDGVWEHKEMIIGTERDSPTDWYWIIVKVQAGDENYLPTPFNTHSCIWVTGSADNIKISGKPTDNILNCHY
ncbi:21617_t:CDS:1, partial [Gigaspora rosea]